MYTSSIRITSITTTQAPMKDARLRAPERGGVAAQRGAAGRGPERLLPAGRSGGIRNSNINHNNDDIIISSSSSSTVL